MKKYGIPIAIALIAIAALAALIHFGTLQAPETAPTGDGNAPATVRIDTTVEPPKVVGLPPGGDLDEFALIRLEGKDEYFVLHRPRGVMDYDLFAAYIGPAEGLARVKLLEGSRTRCGDGEFVTERGTFKVEISPCGSKRIATFKGLPLLKDFKHPATPKTP